MLRIKKPTRVEEPQHTLPFFNPRMVCHLKNWCLLGNNMSNGRRRLLNKRKPCLTRVKRVQCEKENTWKERRNHMCDWAGGKTHQTFMVSTPGHCSNNWYMDSCYSHHMNQHKESFSTYWNIFGKKQLVERIEGVVLYAQSISNIVFKTWIDGKEKTCILKDVIHVPKLNKN